MLEARPDAWHGFTTPAGPSTRIMAVSPRSCEERGYFGQRQTVRTASGRGAEAPCLGLSDFGFTATDRAMLPSLIRGTGERAREEGLAQTQGDETGRDHTHRVLRKSFILSMTMQRLHGRLPPIPSPAQGHLLQSPFLTALGCYRRRQGPLMVWKLLVEKFLKLA